MWRLLEGAAVEPKLGKSTLAAQSRGEAGDKRYLAAEMAQHRQNTVSANSPNLIECGQLLASHERHHFKTLRHLTAEREQVFERKLSAATVLKRYEIRSTKQKEDDHERVCISLSRWRGWQVP
jgi:hypothetical protein